MAYPSVTYSFSPNEVIYSARINQNYSDLVSGFSSGTKSINMADATFTSLNLTGGATGTDLSCNSLSATDGTFVNLTVDSTVLLGPGDVSDASNVLHINNQTDGDRGISITTPYGADLHMNAYTMTSMGQKFGIDKGANSFVYSDVGSMIFGVTGNPIIFCSTDEKVRITSQGRVGIGITNPSYQLQLSTDSAAKPSTNTWSVASDKRIKKNIEKWDKYGLNTLLKLQPYSFQYNGLAGFSDDGQRHVGYVAQDVVNVVPEMVSSSQVKMKPDDKEETEILSVNTHTLDFIQNKAIRELHKKIEILETKIEILERKI